MDKEKELGNVLVIPDLHYRKKAGGEDKRSIDAMLKYAGDHKWSHVVLLGDVLDNNSISSHNKGLLKTVEGETILADYAVANKSLDELESATRGATKVVIEGNHDYRTTALVDQQPQLEGLVETPNGLQLKRRGWVWVPYWSKGTIYSLGKASFIHGRYTNDLHSKKHALAYGRNIYYGHCFDEKTELLTTNGWKTYKEINKADQAITLNMKTHRLEPNSIQAFHLYDNYTEMYQIRNQHVDLLVTDKHGLIDVDTTCTKYTRYAAKDYTDRSVHRFMCGGLSDRKGISLSDDWIRLAIWIVADGTFENSSLVRFHLKKERKIQRLRALLDTLHISYSINPQKAGTVKINFTQPTNLNTYFDRNIKRLPEQFRDATQAQAQVILEEYIHTDGCQTAEQSYQLSTAKVCEADLLQEIMVVNGYRCNKTKSGRGWILSIYSGSRLSELRRDTNFSVVPYKGDVWCVTVPNGSLIVRRNGKVCITQNTHTHQSYTCEREGDNNKYEAASLGCLCEYQQDYLRGNPTKWQQGFGVFRFQRGGFFNRYFVAIFGHRFVSPEGKEYRG